jgi:hypothetical protein
VLSSSVSGAQSSERCSLIWRSWPDSPGTDVRDVSKAEVFFIGGSKLKVEIKP